MSNEEAYQLAKAITQATMKGEPLPPIPDDVPPHAVRLCVALGEMRRATIEARDK